MRIAGFIRLWPTHRGVGGMQGHAQNLYRGLAQRGHDVEVFTTRHPDLPNYVEEEGVKIHYVEGCKPAVYTDAYFRVVRNKFRERHSAKPFDVIHSESQAAKLLLNEGVPVCAQWHGMGFCNFRNRVNDAMVRGKLNKMVSTFHKGFASIVREVFDFQKYHYHIAISHQAHQDLQDIYKIPKDRLFLVFNGFDTRRFKINEAAGLEIRKRLRIPENAFVIGCGGRLTPEKGHPILMQVAQKFVRRFHDTYFLVLGSGPYLENYKRLKSPKIVTTGPIPYEEMGNYYNAMDVFANPTQTYSGLDMVMQEAMLCGLPVVATDSGSIKKSLLPSTEYGYTFELGNSGDLFNKLAQIKTENTKAKGEAAYKFVRKFCTLDTMCKGVERVLRQAIKRGPIE